MVVIYNDGSQLRVSFEVDASLESDETENILLASQTLASRVYLQLRDEVSVLGYLPDFEPFEGFGEDDFKGFYDDEDIPPSFWEDE